jgi:formylglycine-generating enzyme required for sulfatase activity
VTRAARLIALVGLIGCAESAPPRPQWLITVSTDARLPQLGDRLLLEVVDASGASACDGCVRQFAADADAWPLSFGVAAPDATRELFVRATLFRADHLGAGARPIGKSYVEVAARLPPAGDVVAVGLDLPMACFGVPSDVAAGLGCDPRTGALAPIATLAAGSTPTALPGSWSDGAEVPCDGEPPADMICVPGGAFVLGSPFAFLTDGALGSLPDRLVKLSPFALDADEVTVGLVRRLYDEGKIARLPRVSADNPMCTFGQDDALPVTCVDHALAQEICEAQDKRLPREAEWEFAAGNRDLESRYPWGERDDVCCMTVVSRGRFGVEPDYCRVACSEATLPWGAVVGGAPGDVTALGIRNLGGNVAEWVDGAAARYDDACWQPATTLLVDPVCDVALGPNDYGSVRGGAWTLVRSNARAFERSAAQADSQSFDSGVRCAVSM